MPTIPNSLEKLLSLFRNCFSVPTYSAFTALFAGFIACIGLNTVCGILQAGNLVGVWHHSKAYDFFSRRRWSVDRVSLVLFDLIVELLLKPCETIRIVIDDTLFHRSGPKVFGSQPHHDASLPSTSYRIRSGNCWVVVGVLVKLPLLTRTLCLPVMFSLSFPKGNSPTKPYLARNMVDKVISRYSHRRIEIVADSAYACEAFADLHGNFTFTARLRSNAALYKLPPPPDGKPGRPRKRGDRLPTPKQMAAMTDMPWRTVTIDHCSRKIKREISLVRCQWYSVFKERQVNVVVVRNPLSLRFEAAFLSTDIEATPEEIVEHYGKRWAIEVAFQEAKQVMGVGQARNRSRGAVLRTVPFGFICQSILTVWYALNGHAELDVLIRREQQPWYLKKSNPSTFDMLVALRREIIASQFMPEGGRDPTCGKYSYTAWELGAIVG